jgi:hypothetical protein
MNGQKDKQNMAQQLSRILFGYKSYEILIYDTTWMSLKNIILNETNQSQKSQSDSFYLKIQNREIYRNRKDISDWGGMGGIRERQLQAQSFFSR